MTTQTLDSPKLQRKPLTVSWATYKWPLYFMLSMSMMGLMFPLGYVLVPIILISSYRRDRYDFVIMLMIFLGGFGLIGEDTLPIKVDDITLIISIVLLFIYRKRAIVLKVVTLWIVYCAVIFIISCFSEETLAIQIRLMRYYFMFICFLIPISCFSREKFDMQVFFEKLMPYIMIMCVFYIIDGFILCGNILLPKTHLTRGLISTFYSPFYKGFFNFHRKYPIGLIFIALSIYPMVKCYKLNIYQWLVIVGGLMSTQTFTVISGIFVGTIAALITMRKVVPLILGVVGLFFAIYLIDCLMPERIDGWGDSSSFFRIKSSIEQIQAVREAQDDEDIAEFGSGRIAEALPKLEMVNHYNRNWTGLGFIHPQLTTNTKYIINNEYYKDQSENEEAATGIEIEFLQVYITVGYLGLIAYFLFFGSTYAMIRKYRYSRYYLSVLIIVFWFSLGGFTGFTMSHGQIILGLAFAATLLAQRQKEPGLF